MKHQRNDSLKQINQDQTAIECGYISVMEKPTFLGGRVEFLGFIK